MVSSLPAVKFTPVFTAPPGALLVGLTALLLASFRVYSCSRERLGEMRTRLESSDARAPPLLIQCYIDRDLELHEM